MRYWYTPFLNVSPKLAYDNWQQRRLRDTEHRVTSLFVDHHGELYSTSLEGRVYVARARPPAQRGYLPVAVQPW